MRKAFIAKLLPDKSAKNSGELYLEAGDVAVKCQVRYLLNHLN